MKKGKLVKTVFFSIIFTAVLFVLVVLTFGTWLNDATNGVLTSVGATPLFSNAGRSFGLLPAFDELTMVTFGFSVRNIGLTMTEAGVKSFLLSCVEGWQAVFTNFRIELIPFIVYWVVLVVAVLAVIIVIIQCFTHRNGNLIWIAIFGIIVAIFTLYTIAGLNICIFGPSALKTYAVDASVSPTDGYIYLLVVDLGKSLNMDDVQSLIWKICVLVLAVLVAFFVIANLITSLVYLIQAFVYTHSHKYDYLTRRERKEKIKYYKEHGFKNINEKNKGQAPAQEAPTPAYANAAQIPPYGYAPYGYPVNGAVVPPQAGGNVVQTGNNAPLIVQYITTSGDEKLKSSKPDAESAGLYGTRVTHVESAPSLTRDDIKNAVIDVLRENDLLKSDVVVAPVTHVEEERKEETIEDKYDLLTIDDLRNLIKETVGAKEETKEEKVATEEDVRRIVSEALVKETAPVVATEVPVAHEPVKEVHKEEKAVAPIVVAMPEIGRAHV